jgi:hypothetical protein
MMRAIVNKITLYIAVQGRASTSEQEMLRGVLVFIGVMIAFMYAPQILFAFHTIMNPPGMGGATHPPQPPPLQNPHNPPKVHPRDELLSGGVHFKGKPTATYTIIEFADYANSHCAKSAAEMDALLKRYPDRFRLAFRNYPLGRWPYSRAEAAAAEAAGLQGKFWEMHDLLFKHQSEVEARDFGPAVILNWGKSLGLDVTKLKKDMASGPMIARVQHDHYIGEKNHIWLAPSFFVIPSDPKGKVMMIVGETDLKTVLDDPNDPFWSGDRSSLKYPETDEQNPFLVTKMSY